MATQKDRQIAVAVIGGVFALLVAVVTVALPRLLDTGSAAGATPTDPVTASTTSRTPPTVGPTRFTPPTFEKPSVFLSKESAPGGASVLVSGEGFAAGEKVLIRVHTTKVATTQANAAGSFSKVAITIPTSLSVFAPLQVDVVAVGQSSIRSGSAPITVSG